MKSKVFAAVCAIVALGTIVWAGAQAASGGHANPTAVAVANVQNIFNNLKERQQIQATMKSKLDNLQNQQQAKQKKIQDLKSQLQVLQSGSKAYANKEAELEQSAIGLKAWVQYQQKKVSRDRALQIEQLYRKLTKAVEKVAKSDGYDVVLYGGGGPKFQYQNENQLAGEIQTRKVIWASQSVNITDQVTQLMNNNFENAGG